MNALDASKELDLTHQHRLEHTYPAALAVLVVIALQLSLQEKLTLGPNWLMPALEAILMFLLLLSIPRHNTLEFRYRRMVVIGLIALMNFANLYSLSVLLAWLLQGGFANGAELLFDALKLWLTNIILFTLWYWELDAGGPVARMHKKHEYPDFLFTQMTSPQFAQSTWRPSFVDYLFLSFTNASAFSPTDTLPLSPRAKMLMLIQALISLVTVALVAARAVNILP